MFTLGKNCHITLSHPEIDSGSPYGFILKVDSLDLGPAVVIQREKNAAGDLNVKVFFTLVLGEELLNPDGSKHADSRYNMHQKFVQFLAKESNLTLSGSFGILPNVGASGHAATESHYGSLTFIACQLINAGAFSEPLNGQSFLASCWDGSLNWDTSYWR